MNCKSFVTLFGLAVDRFPERTAIFSGNTSITYKQLFLRAKVIASHIDIDSDNIGVYTSTDIDTYAAIIGILFAKKKYITFNSKNTSERNREIIEQASIQLVFCASEIPDLGKKVVIKNTTTLLHLNEAWGFSSVEKANSIHYILFTSGSTGKPKGVPIHESNISIFLHRMLHKEGYDFNENDSFLQPFELSFDLSIFSYMVPLCVGASFHIVGNDKVFYLGIIEILENENITVALMVPSVINYLEPYFSEIELPYLRLSLFCGEALYASKTKGWEKCLPNGRIENVYGPTEATIFFTRYKWQNDSYEESINDIVPIGTPMNGLSVAINHEEGSNEIAGEIILIGDQVTSGYYNDEMKSKEAFSFDGDNYRYRTGDLGYYNERGNIIFCGRKDSQVKVNGYRIELAEVEYLAKRVFLNNNIVALTKHNDKSGLQIVLIIEEKDDPILTNQDELRRRLAEHLPSYMMPQQLKTISLFPYNLSGKVDRNQLKNYLNE